MTTPMSVRLTAADVTALERAAARLSARPGQVGTVKPATLAASLIRNGVKKILDARVNSRHT